MKYYRQTKALLILALIALLCLWLHGCDSFTETELLKSQLIKTAIFKDIKTVSTALFTSAKAKCGIHYNYWNNDEIHNLMWNTVKYLNT